MCAMLGFPRIKSGVSATYNSTPLPTNPRTKKPGACAPGFSSPHKLSILVVVIAVVTVMIAVAIAVMMITVPIPAAVAATVVTPVAVVRPA